MTRKPWVVVLLVCVSWPQTPGTAEIRNYQLGDVDDFAYNGPGSVDDVYVDPDLITWLQGVAPSESNDDFDTLNYNNNVPFAFFLPLSPGEQITSATLELGLRATASLVTNDWLVLPENDVWYVNGSNRSSQDVYTYSDLGWHPIDFTGTTVRSVDLSNINGDDQLSLLQDGQFDAYITDDTAVDYVKLSIDVIRVAPIPEPTTIVMLALATTGLGGYLRKRRNT